MARPSLAWRNYQKPSFDSRNSVVMDCVRQEMASVHAATCLRQLDPQQSRRQWGLAYLFEGLVFVSPDSNKSHNSLTIRQGHFSHVHHPKLRQRTFHQFARSETWLQDDVLPSPERTFKINGAFKMRHRKKSAILNQISNITYSKVTGKGAKRCHLREPVNSDRDKEGPRGWGVGERMGLYRSTMCHAATRWQ